MADDLHRSTWFTYRRAICGDASWDAGLAFQAALDVVLRRRPGIDAVSACSEAARMIMTRPRGIGNRGRIVAADVDAHKLDELRRRARRAGVTSAQPLHLEGGRWPPALRSRPAASS